MKNKKKFLPIIINDSERMSRLQEQINDDYIETIRRHVANGIRLQEQANDNYMEMIRQDANNDAQFFDEQWQKEQQMLAEIESDRAGTENE